MWLLANIIWLALLWLREKANQIQKNRRTFYKQLESKFCFYPPNRMTPTTQNQKQDIALAGDYKINALDVLCSRDKDSFFHEGNRHFRIDVEMRAVRYNDAKSRRGKAAIIDEIIDAVHKRGGIFLLREPTKQAAAEPKEPNVYTSSSEASGVASSAATYYQMSRRKIADKVGKALRVAFRKMQRNNRASGRQSWHDSPKYEKSTLRLLQPNLLRSESCPTPSMHSNDSCDSKTRPDPTSYEIVSRDIPKVVTPTNCMLSHGDRIVQGVYHGGTLWNVPIRDQRPQLQDPTFPTLMLEMTPFSDTPLVMDDAMFESESITESTVEGRASVFQEDDDDVDNASSSNDDCSLSSHLWSLKESEHTEELTFTPFGEASWLPCEHVFSDWNSRTPDCETNAPKQSHYLNDFEASKVPHYNDGFQGVPHFQTNWNISLQDQQSHQQQLMFAPRRLPLKDVLFHWNAPYPDDNMSAPLHPIELDCPMEAYGFFMDLHENHADLGSFFT